MKIDDLRRHYGSARRAVSAGALPVVVPQAEGASTHLQGVLPGAVHPLSGDSFFTDTWYDGSETWGRHRIKDLLDVAPSALSLVARDPDLTHLDVRSTLFLDTETTGLGIGTGTYVFLVGVGVFTGDGFRIRQYFLGSPTDECAMLTHLAQFLAGYDAVVTFNGKAFDLPILENRFVLHRQVTPLSNPRHADLLHVARRLWKKRLASCALTSLEVQVLGLPERADDVAGFEIPLCYFQFQRSGDALPLVPVFHHNLRDILSLATLLVHIGGVVRDPLGALVDHPSDLFCVGYTYERAGETQQAVQCYEEALRRNPAPELRRDCRLRLAGTYKRERMWEEARDVWDSLVEDGGAEALFALIERAKYLEHIERDYAQALEDVQTAVRIAELRGYNWPGMDIGALEHRLSRLVYRSLKSHSGRRRV